MTISTNSREPVNALDDLAAEVRAAGFKPGIPAGLNAAPYCRAVREKRCAACHRQRLECCLFYRGRHCRVLAGCAVCGAAEEVEVCHNTEGESPMNRLTNGAHTAPPRIPARELLSAKEVGALLGFATRTIWRWAAEGRLPRPIHFGPKAARWRREDVERIAREGLAG
jgi:predicted DNA-binding transcriptional regulator AlpA